MRRAVIMAGGLGSRLRPFTVSLPKPLMPVGDQPILEIIIRLLARSGFDHVTLAVNYQADIMRAFCGDGSRWGVKIDYVLERQRLSTMGPLRLIDDLPETFLVMNGDVLTDLRFDQFYEAHVAEGRLFSISASRREQLIDYGVLEVGGNNELSGFQEKPRIPYLVSMGVYCASRRVLDWIPPDTPFGFDHLVLALLAQHQPVRVVPHEGYWLDIGRIDDYQRATDDWPILSKQLGL